MSLGAERLYCLQLANGHRWNLVATDGTSSWVDSMATIMGLKLYKPGVSNGSSKLIIIRTQAEENSEGIINTLDPEIRANLPDGGWKIKDKLLPADGSHIRFWYHDEVPDIVYYIEDSGSQEKNIMRMWHLTYVLSLREQLSGGFLFHSGMIQRNGRGVLLAADGGIGKTTCCRRILHPWHSPSDDQALIVRDDQNYYYLHPFPTWSEYLWKYSGRTWNVEEYTPLSAIFFLKQAETDRVEPLGQTRSAALISEYASQGAIVGKIFLDKDEQHILLRRLFNNACELAKTIPTYILEVSLKGKFWDEIEKVLSV